ncbi:MAG: Fic family protein, partial [Clostridia bacterium]|nr:Fic family protein [Deltaproteobacteria bacterium]
RPLSALRASLFESSRVLKSLAGASRALAELNGRASSIPNEKILISTLALREAKASSAIENIVTTQDAIYREQADELLADPAAKEVLRYASALRSGYEVVRRRGVLSTSTVVDIQEQIEPNKPGFRKLPGTSLKDQRDRIVYTPPDPSAIAELMSDLTRFMNNADTSPLDPLVRMAVAHHQFESIHPFYDGNGRTGRILNVLTLVLHGLLETPILYLSRPILATKSQYYSLLQRIRDEDDAPDAWDAWIIYLLEAVSAAANAGTKSVLAIAAAMQELKHRMRIEVPKLYSHDLLNNLFTNPYTRIDFVMRDLEVSRITATKYLDELGRRGFVRKVRAGRSNYYVNDKLVTLLSETDTPAAKA